MRLKLVLFLCFLGFLGMRGQTQESCRIAFWNVENFFDTQHDSLKEDYPFTPKGDNHWTYKRYSDKCNKIYKTIAALKWPSVMGLAEVENDKVLRDLCLGTPLRRFHYSFVHYESPDVRGVDCALLFRSDHFSVIDSRAISISDSSAHFFSRDILLVHGVLTACQHSDTCYFFVNHWPSKLGGAEADLHRMRIAHTLLASMDSIQQLHPTALILAMGDFNSSMEEESIRTGLHFEGRQRNPEGFYNLMYNIPKGEGSYKYQGQWSCIDQMISNRNLTAEIFSPMWLLTEDSKYLGLKPFRTYIGMQYLGGYSDHLPLIATIPH